MNDRFKFRVWDKKEKRFIDHPQINPLFGCVCGYENSTYPLQIEQCTGFSDKNGKLIYEGDIIKDEFYRRFTIVWSEEDCMFEGRVIYRDPEYSDRFDLYKGATDNCEIIGNIHEQAEQKDKL